MSDQSNPLFRALDAAGGSRDGEFIRALADRVDTHELFFEPDVECGVQDALGDEEYVNINWVFAVPRAWLMRWIEGTPGGSDVLRRHPGNGPSSSHHRGRGSS